MDQIYNLLWPIKHAGHLIGIFPGKYRDAESVDLDDQLRAGPPQVSGYFSYKLKERVAAGQINPGNVQISGLLCVYLPSDVSTNMGCVIQLAEMILACLNNEAAFRCCGAKPVRNIYIPQDDNVDDKILQIEFESEYQIGPTGGTD
jgi:hypothetical protein